MKKKKEIKSELTDSVTQGIWLRKNFLAFLDPTKVFSAMS